MKQFQKTKTKILNKFRKASYVLLLVWALVGFVILSGGCKQNPEWNMKIEKNTLPYADMESVKVTGQVAVYVDKETGVLYFNWGGGYTPLYNADGSLKNISQFENTEGDT